MIVSRLLRAPQDHGAILAQPPLSEAAGLVAENRRRLGLPAPPLLGCSWADLRRQARLTALAVARDYLQGAGELIPSVTNDSLFMSGHQPELFHPGVWVKNFALNGLARAHGAAPLNLVVDNDTAKSTAIHVPVAEGGVHLATVPFDRWIAEVPFEERSVNDEALFASFPNRVADAVRGWDLKPLLPEFWDEARRQARRTPLLGERLVAARRALERRWGCHNLEVPASLVCRTEPFAWFACHLLTELPRFHSNYNSCLREYRKVNGIRSRAHPVPDLAMEEEWLEVPLWAWRSDRPRRQRVFARQVEAGVELRIGAEAGPMLPLRPGGAPGPNIAAWQELERSGLKIRSRALTTTLYARLFLADLFIHGIGGAKYDELTDEIVRRFYGFEPPGYLVLTATLRLPLPSFPAQEVDCRRLARELRDLNWNPQRHLGDDTRRDSAIEELVARKRDWIVRQPPTATERRERFQILHQLTEQLRLFLSDQEKRARQELERCQEQVQANAILQRRDFASCLFSEEELRALCSRVFYKLCA